VLFNYYQNLKSNNHLNWKPGIFPETNQRMTLKLDLGLDQPSGGLEAFSTNSTEITPFVAFQRYCIGNVFRNEMEIELQL